MSDQRAICGEHCVCPNTGCHYYPYIVYPSLTWEGFDAEICVYYENVIYKHIREATKTA